jgi:dihydroxyacetone kinase
MSYIVNDPDDFAAESTLGFIAAHRGLVRRVNGGVARASATPAGEVAVVIGGGSGHYPAFAGLVGPGLAHAAAMGNVFASPSAQQIYSVARSVATEAGVLFSYGNYAGDALNFDQAQERLRAEGIPTATVRVTDDIYSAPLADRAKRRGIAGDLAVFRAAAWASAQGMGLAEVEAVAARANERTRSVGVAFSGCTLPGATAPLFTVPDGMMAVGMGIHGEPGIDVVPLPSAGEIADLLVTRLLEERPHDLGDGASARVGVIVNGLGSVKSEELFLLYHSVAGLITQAGLEIVDPEVGEYATSFEMAGVSLTLIWLDDVLEQAWSSPAYAPAYRKGVVDLADRIADENAAEGETAEDDVIHPAATADAQRAGKDVARALSAIRAMIDREVDALGRLDAIAGDGDHGIGMQRGVRAADAAAQAAAGSDAGPGTVLARAGDAWADKAGGTSGALWGLGLRAAAKVLGDATAPDGRTASEAVAAARDAVQTSGKAQIGDKTMVDALVPFAETLAERIAGGDDLATAWEAAAAESMKAARATADLLPRMGRARPHMEKSLGTPDPGAMSLALAMAAGASAWNDGTTEEKR